MGLFFDPELLNPKIHCFSKCHFCKKLIRITRDANENLDFSERECPYCGVHIAPDRMWTSFVETAMLTSSITSANKLQSLDPAIIIFVAVGGIMLAIGYPVSFRMMVNFMFLFPLIFIYEWFRRYWYKFRSDDPEYLETLKGMKRSVVLWIAGSLLNWSLLLFQPTFFGDR